ncbi:hypothetical protein ACVWU4_000875 [Campylobacter coli]
MAGVLTSSLTESEYISKDIILKWNSIVPVIERTTTLKDVTIDIKDANLYTHNLEGLLRDKFNINKEFVYPTIRINGYDCSEQYDGRALSFKLIDPYTLEKYYRIIKRN